MTERGNAFEAKRAIRSCSYELADILHDAEGGNWNGAGYRDGNVLRFDMVSSDGRTALEVSARTWVDLSTAVWSMLEAARMGMRAAKSSEAMNY